MPGLLEGAAPLKTSFAVSLPYCLFGTISLMCAVPEYEGLGDWLRDTRLSLPPDLADELCVLSTFPGRYQRFIEEVLARLRPEGWDWGFGALRTYLESLSPEEYQQMALRALVRGAPEPVPPDEIRRIILDPQEGQAYLQSMDSHVARDLVAALISNGETLKQRFVTAVERFWQETYAAEYEATRPLMERSVAYHRAQRYGPDFRDVFVTVTGRLIPQPVAALLPDVDRVTLIPSCYIGLYVTYMRHGRHLILFYNCRSTPGEEEGVPAGVPVALYPPLKALADETRLSILALLRGRELYAQEIVDQLDISQPAVSRHLNLMVAAGVLTLRREGNARYYAINDQTLRQLVDALSCFI